MELNNQNGAYAIQEQGDLGLGTIPVDKKYVKEDGTIETPEFGEKKKETKNN